LPCRTYPNPNHPHMKYKFHIEIHPLGSVSIAKLTLWKGNTNMWIVFCRAVSSAKHKLLVFLLLLLMCSCFYCVVFFKVIVKLNKIHQWLWRSGPLYIMYWVYVRCYLVSLWNLWQWKHLQNSILFRKYIRYIILAGAWFKYRSSKYWKQKVSSVISLSWPQAHSSGKLT